MENRAAVTSLVTVLAAVTSAFVVGGIAQFGLGFGPLVVMLLTMAVVACLFAVRLPEGLAAFATAVLVAESVGYWTGLDIRYVDEAGLAVLIVTGLVVHRRRISIPPLGAPDAGVAVLALAGIASSLVQDVPAHIWIPALLLMGKGVAFFYLLRLLPMDLGEVRRAGFPVVAVGLAIAAIGLVQFVSPSIGEWLRLPPTGQRGGFDVAGSIFTHPALYGWLTVFVSLLLYARFAVLRDRWALVLALMANVGTLLSGRRSPIVGVVVALVFGAARQLTAGRRLGLTWAAVGGAVLVVLVASVPMLGDFYASTLDRYGARPEVVAEIFADEPDPAVVAHLQPRVALYAGSVAIAADELPFGAGVGRYGSHVSRETYSPWYEAYGMHRTYGLRQANPRAVTDTFWPMILGETGVFGLAGALLFFAGLTLRLWRAAGADASPEVRAITLGVLLVFVEGLVRALISQAFVAPPISYFVFGAAAVSLGLQRQRSLLTSEAAIRYSGGRGTPRATAGSEAEST